MAYPLWKKTDSCSRSRGAGHRYGLLAKKKAKAERKKERQANNDKGGDLEDMIAYVDENGNIVDEDPEETDET